VIDVGQAQPGADKHPTRFGAKGGPAGQWELADQPVVIGGALEPASPISDQSLRCRDVLHGGIMATIPDRSRPHYWQK
jgi:hypothetical protein